MHKIGRWLIVGVATALAVLGYSSAASAQDDGATDGTTATGTEVKGTLRADDAAGEKYFLANVEFEVTDADGNVIGTAVSDENGEWSIPLPGAGTYKTFLLVETLPEGMSLRDAEKNPLTFEVNEGDSRPNLFPMGEKLLEATTTIKAVQLAVDGIKLGLIIAMCAIGLSLIYGTTRLVNFAHGEMVTFGAMMAYLFHVTWEGSSAAG